MLFWTIALSFCALLQAAQGSSHGLWGFNSGPPIHSPATFLTETRGGLYSLRGNGGREEVTRERDFRRQKRQAVILDASLAESTVAIEIHFADSSLQDTIRSYLNSLPFPLLINASDPTESISSIQVTTVCNSTRSNSTHCYCEDGYAWPSEACTNPVAPDDNCISQLPSQGIYCERLPEDARVTYIMSVQLNIPFQDALSNPSSKLYEQYKRDLERAFTVGYKTLQGFISANVTQFKSGSTVVDYEVTSARAIPVESASQAVAAALNSSYNLDPTSFRTSSVEIFGGTNISISPKPIFKGDTVTMRCESRSKSSDVAWSNGGRPISNSSRHLITREQKDGKSISVLKIQNILLNESGEYSCAFTEQDTQPTTVHVAEGNVTVSSIQIVKSKDIVMVCNGEKRELSCCVDMEISFFDVRWKLNGAISISGTNDSKLNCSYYVLQASESQCPADKSGTSTIYTCELSTADGARQSKDIAVTYLREAKVTLVSSTNGQISEGGSFSLRCLSDVGNYNKVSWRIQNGNPVPAIDSVWYTTTKTQNGAESVLIVRQANQNWNGTYTCTFFQEPLHSSAHLSMEVFPLPLKQGIFQDPIEAIILCPGSQILKCCVATGRMDNYIVTFQIGIRPSSIQNGRTQEGNLVCYTGTLRYDNCDHAGLAFSASCEFQNKIGGRVQSFPMSLKLARENTIRCNSPNIGAGEPGAEVVKPCLGNDTSVRGNITYRCDPPWVMAQNNCLSVPVNDLVLGAESLVSGPAPVQMLPTYLESLNKTVKTEQKDISNSSANLEAVVGILNMISVIPVDAKKETMENFLSTVDTVISTPTATWNAVTNGSSQLLYSVEQFSNSLIAVNDIIPSISLENIQLQGVVLDNISDYNKNFIFSALSNLSGNVLINETEIERGNLFHSTIISVAYSNLSSILPQHQQSEELINGLVISTVVKVNESEPFEIQMAFAKMNKSLINPRCVFWNFSFSAGQGGWDSTGCETKNSEDIVNCSCNHLTSFSVLMSPPENYDDSQKRVLSYISYIGVGISVLSLVACVVIEALVWKSVTKTRISYMRHICILNIAISLLIADIWFIVIAAKEDKMGTAICTAVTFFTHFFYLCVFFWMLSLSLMIFYHLVFILHSTSKTTMKAVAFCLGYGCPLVISAITIAVTLPQDSYIRGNICFLAWDKSHALLALVVPALVIVAINAVVTIVVLVKIPIRSIGERPRNDERSSLYRITKSFSILTPLLGLTWGFGLATIFKGSSIVFHILFNVLNAFQGLFILLFGILWDRKVREALLSQCALPRCRSKTSKSSSSQGHAAPMLSISSPFSRSFNNLFGKTGKYQVSSTESASSSSENTSKEYSLLT